MAESLSRVGMLAEQISGLEFMAWVSEPGSRVYGLGELNHGVGSSSSDG